MENKTKTKTAILHEENTSSDINKADYTIPSQVLKAQYVKAIMSWVNMIAALSLVNVVFEIAKIPLSFPIGFGFNYLVSGFLDATNQAEIVITIGSVVSALICSGLLVGLGYLFRKGAKWAFYLIIAMYCLDSLLILAVLIFSGGAMSILIDLAFHVYALTRMITLFTRFNKFKD